MSDLRTELLKTKCASGTGKFREWLEVLRGAAKRDEEGDAVYERKKKIFVFCVLASVVSIVAGLINGKGDAPMIGGAISLALFLFGLVVLISARMKFRRTDLVNELRQTLVPFLEYMEEDISPSAQVRYRLDLAGPVKGKVVRTWKEKIRGFNHTFTLYQDPWLEFRVKLKDGNIMELKGEITWLKRVRSHKQKVKWKKVSVLTASVTARAEGFQWDMEAVERAVKERGMKFNPAKDGGRLSMTKKFKFVRKHQECPQKSPSPKQVAGMFMEIYKCSKAIQEKRNG